MFELLEARELNRRREREILRNQVLVELRKALSDLVPKATVYIYGSLISPFRFHRFSDLDIAFTSLPPGVSPYSLQAQLEERMKRRVDLVELDDTRLKSAIEERGEKWTL